MTAPELWFLLADDTLRDTLCRAQAGEDVDALMFELWANAVHDPDDDHPAPEGTAVMCWTAYPDDLPDDDAAPRTV